MRSTLNIIIIISTDHREDGENRIDMIIISKDHHDYIFFKEGKLAEEVLVLPSDKEWADKLS